MEQRGALCLRLKLIGGKLSAPLKMISVHIKELMVIDIDPNIRRFKRNNEKMKGNE